MPLRLISPLHRANRQTSIYLEAKLAEIGLSSPEAHIVSYVHVYGPCTVGELLRVFGYKAPTMTSMLDRLATRDLIRRELNPEDRRSFVVTATQPGAALASVARKHVEKLDRSIRRRVSAEDLRGFQRVIDAIAEITGVNVRSTGPGTSPKTERR